MPKFSFTVEVDDPEKLIKANYHLCAQKATKDKGLFPVQWLGTKLRGANVSVSWEEHYAVYYTVTTLDSGAVITQSSQLPTELGKSYSFENGKFKAREDPNVGKDTVGIFNIKEEIGAFGLSQEVRVDGDAKLFPLVVNTILPQGTGTFTPLEKLQVYFANSNTSPGCITAAVSSNIEITLQAGTQAHLFFSAGTGKWTLRPEGGNGRSVPPSPVLQPAISSLYLVQAEILLEGQTDELWLSTVIQAIGSYVQEKGITVFREPRKKADRGRRFKFVFGGKALHDTDQVVRQLAGRTLEQVYHVPTPDEGGYRIHGVGASVSHVHIEEGKPAILAWNNSSRRIED